jgi:hypothetical protein
MGVIIRKDIGASLNKVVARLSELGTFVFLATLKINFATFAGTTAPGGRLPSSVLSMTLFEQAPRREAPAKWLEGVYYFEA